MTPPAKTVDPCPFSHHYRIADEQGWQSLRIFLLYRFTLANMLVSLYFFKLGPSLLGRSNPFLYEATSSAYLGATLFGAVAVHWRRPAFSVQAPVVLLIDLIAITLLMHACGGIESGFGLLLAVPVAAAALMLGGRCALLFAAVASLGVLGTQVYAHYTNAFPRTAYTYAGMLGVSFFTIAVLAHVLARRAERSEALAAQRGAAVANLQQLNHFIIQHLQSGIVLVDPRRRIRMMNDSALRLFDLAYPPDRIDALSPQLGERYREWLACSDRDSAVLRTAGDAEIRIRFSEAGKDHEPIHMIFLEDRALTQQRVQQSKLASLGRLTASIAHEIRNPLGAISYASQLLAESALLSTQDRRLTAIIQQHSARVNEIIENILQLSRRTPSRCESIALGAWLDTFLDEFALEQQLEEPPFKLDMQAENLRVRMDASHLKQILDNLCINALKHGGRRGEDIEVRARRSGKHDSPCIEVIDRGPGIARRDAAQLFEPFFTTSPSGTGLGLYIARELAELNQAEVEYEPAPGGGSCFRVCLPDADRTVVEL